jgi:hypothetical protein
MAIRRLFLFAAIPTVTAILACAPAHADDAARQATADNFAAGTLKAGDAALAAMAQKDPANQDARLGLGMIRFVAAVEHLSQGFYRYGLESPKDALVPFFRLPVPENPNPQPATYEAIRGVLQGFVDDLTLADKTLAEVTSPQVKVPVDIRKISYDADGSGMAGADERLITVMNVIAGIEEDDLPADATVAFDLGDALWLRGYCHVLMALGDFLLAHDWHEGFNASFHEFFPRANLPLAAALANQDKGFEESIADWVTFVHLLRWPVLEPKRMTGVRDHLKMVLQLSRDSWKAIEAETDNDREWLAGPKQKSAIVDLEVTDEMLASWRQLLDEADAVLDGRTLVPHWRLKKGINIRKVFEQPTTFDLVMWVTGPAALPYLEDGPMTSEAHWERALRSFGTGFGNYLAWFN